MDFSSKVCILRDKVTLVADVKKQSRFLTASDDQIAALIKSGLPSCKLRSQMMGELEGLV